MFIKKITMLTLVVTSLSLPVLSFSLEDLKITNNTDLPSTSILNHGACSTSLPGGIGITYPTKGGAPHIIPAFSIKVACLTNAGSCAADIYMTDHCGAPDQKVATVIFNAKDDPKIGPATGFVSVTYPTAIPQYLVTGSGFNITISKNNTLPS